MTDIAIDTVRTIRGADMPAIPPAVHHFDMLRSLGVLAHDPARNDSRWRFGNAIRDLYRGASRSTKANFLSYLQVRAGPDYWPIIQRIVIDGATAAECADLVPETPAHHTSAIILDRLRVTLDRLAREFPEL
jgi:hypothetical protein